MKYHDLKQETHLKSFASIFSLASLRAALTPLESEDMREKAFL